MHINAKLYEIRNGAEIPLINLEFPNADKKIILETIENLLNILKYSDIKAYKIAINVSR